MSDSDSQPLIDSFYEEEGDQSDEEFLSDAGEEAKLGKQTSFFNLMVYFFERKSILAFVKFGNLSALTLLM